MDLSKDIGDWENKLNDNERVSRLFPMPLWTGSDLYFFDSTSLAMCSLSLLLPTVSSTRTSSSAFLVKFRLPRLAASTASK